MGAVDAGRRMLVGLTVMVLAAGCNGTVGPTLAPAATLESPPAATPTPGPTPSPTPSQAATIGLPADDGAKIIAVESPTALQHRAWVDPGAAGCPASSNPGCWVAVGSPVPTTRARDLTIESPAVGVVHARLLLPLHFGQASTAQWPVLYLYHGGDTDYRLWTEALDVTTLTAPTNLLVVMPDGSTLPDGSIDQSWATFHLVELRQLLERNWQAGDKRAVAGMSMGGNEAIGEAESQPGFFRFAGSYSGALDQSGNLAAALAGTALYVAYGNGKLGPLDNPSRRPMTSRPGMARPVVPWWARPSSPGSPSSRSRSPSTPTATARTAFRTGSATSSGRSRSSSRRSVRNARRLRTGR